MLGNRIAGLRREAGMSQAQLARRLQISPSTVGMYEQGRREPPGETLVALAKLFHVSTDYLLTGQPVTPGDAQTLGRIFEACVERTQRRLERRGEPVFSRQELAVLFAALLTDP